MKDVIAYLTHKGLCPYCGNKIIKSVDNGSAITTYEYINKKLKWLPTDSNPTQDQISLIYYCSYCEYERIEKELDIN